MGDNHRGMEGMMGVREMARWLERWELGVKDL